MIQKDPDNLNYQEKISLGLTALKSFFDSLGGPNDIYKQIVLEETMRFLMYSKKEEKKD